MIVYNILSYIKTIFSFNFSANGFYTTTPDDAIAIIQNGGEEKGQYDRKDIRIQFLARGTSAVTTSKNLNDVYNHLKKRFGFIFPETTVNGVTYPAIITYRIQPLQIPAYIGVDDNGRWMYSFNVVVTTT